jgi:hypothetical protein
VARSQRRPSGSVPLLTGDTGCYAGGESGQAGVLVADPKYGTTFNGMVVEWPQGFRGFTENGVVQIVDPKGTHIATTGRRYYISFAYPYANEPRTIDGLEVYPAAATCGYPWDFVDCAASPAGHGLEDVEQKCRSGQP